MPVYEFEVLPTGFRCTVQAMGLSAIGEGQSKKEAKAGAARRLFERISSNLNFQGKMPKSFGR
ncbi:MAG: hypothetical protein HC851_08645 [Acaryochloris sp. RU_4_1]|nr:hypothetical protein [Acaryochloris sp. RU_4_1]